MSTPIGVVGYGVIGSATASVFPQVAVYDPAKGYQEIQVLRPCPVIFFCVPTPTEPDGSQDLSLVLKAVDEVARVAPTDSVFVIRSTVLPGTIAILRRRYSDLRIHFVSNPEFLRAHRAMDDARDPARIVVGGPPEARYRVVQAYEQSLITDVRRRFVLTDAVTAEVIKYAANGYLAMKISYFNEMYDVVAKYGGEYGALRQALALDPRIGPGEETHVKLTDRGFSDECLPKDLAAFVCRLDADGFPTTMLRGAAEVNSRVRS